MRAVRAFLLILAALHAAAAPPAVELPVRGGVLRLAVTGDTGDGPAAVARGIRIVHAQQPLDAVILTGDNFYPCGVGSAEDERWNLVAPLTSLGIPLLPVLGNHDYCGGADPDAQVRGTGRVANWLFPGRSYVAHSAVADLAFIETTPFAHGQSSTLSADVDAAFEGAAAPWRVVIGHHPVVSSGFHGYFPRDEVRRMRTLLPRLRNSRVDLYVSGHDHHLELIGGTTWFLVSGAGSDPIPPLRLRARTLYPAEIRFERIGFAVVEISASELRVRMYDGEGRPRSGWMKRRRGR